MPKPVRASPNVFPTTPVKKPTIGPKAYPKNMGIAIAFFSFFSSFEV
jgi:hypothetical protein